jgi:DNA-binding MarR family transcriptional regulator
VAAGLTPGAMTSAVDRCEAAGYVRRIRSKTDRRSVQVALTPKCQRLAEEIWGPLAKDGAQRTRAYREVDLRLILKFIQGSRELQALHYARVTGKPAPPVELQLDRALQLVRAMVHPTPET